MKVQAPSLKLLLIGGGAVIALALAIGALNGGGEMPVERDAADVDSFGSAEPDSGDPVRSVTSEEKAAVTGIAPVMPNAAGGATSSSGGGTNAAPSLQDDRKIVQTASMRLSVEEVGASFEDVGRVASAAGGFIASSSFSNQGDAQVASLTIRVPAAEYQSVLSELRELGVKVLSEDSKSSDVTAEYTDLGSRLRNLEATERQMLTLLERATTVGEILQVQDRLNSIRNEIEQVKGRMAMLDKLTELATITVHLQPVAVASTSPDEGSRLGNEISAAWDESIEFLTDIAAGILHVVVFGWWVPIAAVVALLIGRGLLRGHGREARAVD